MTDAPNTSRQSPIRVLIACLLSLTLGLFLVEAGVSLLDDALGLAFGMRVLSLIRGLLFLLLIPVSMLIYLLSGVTPIIPKRFFFPIVLFNPVAQLAMLPLATYHYERIQQISLVASLCEVFCGLSVLFWVQGGFRFRWPLVRQEQLGSKSFSWLNLSAFLLVNAFVLLPGVLLYLFFCASLAVDHFSVGFLALHSDGLATRTKTYVRDDSKTIQLIPMMHIGEVDFYSQISKSFTTNSVILLEGVTDKKHLIKRKLSYKRAAQSLGLVEQQQEFSPMQGRLLPADVDVELFSARSIDFLNLVTRIYSEGWKLEYLLKLAQESEEPQFEEQLWDDLVTKRNANLLKQIDAELPGSEMIVVPWGAIHMRGIAEGIQKSGFHVVASQEHQILHFRAIWNRLVHTQTK